MLIFQICILFSYEITGISKILSNNRAYNFNLIFQTRLSIWGLTTLILIIYHIYFGSTLSQLILIWMITPLSNILQNNFYFLSVENNKFLSLSILSGKFAGVLFVFLYPITDLDIRIVLLIITSCSLIPSYICFRKIVRDLDLKLKHIPLREILNEIKQESNVFLGSASTILMKDFNLIIMNSLGTPASAISIYSLAEKGTKSIQSLLRPLNQIYFKIGVEKLNSCSRPNIETFKKILNLSFVQIIITCALSCIFIFVIWEIDLSLFISIDFNSKLLISLMVPSTIFGVLNYMLGILGLNHLSESKYFMQTMVITGIICVLLTYVLTMYYSNIGTATSFLLSEVILLTLIIRKFLRRT